MRLIIHTDGGARGNPGEAAIGVVVTNPDTKIKYEIAKCIGKATSNQAEYQALIAGLEKAKELKADEIAVRTDSELVARQMTGKWQIKDSTLRTFIEKAKSIPFKRRTIKLIRRESNVHADSLVNAALDAPSNPKEG